jgi:hypothetical protein
MAAHAAAKQVAAKRAEYHVVAELLKGGGTPYLSAVNPGGELLVKTGQGILLELTVLLPVERGGRATRTFAVPDYEPDKKRFIVCVEFDEAESPIAWVFPSMVFWAYGDGSARKGARTLNLKQKRRDLLPFVMHEYLFGFCNRWELIAHYKKYRRYMNSPEGYEDLEDVLSMMVASERPFSKDESVPFKFKGVEPEPVNAVPD